MLFNLSTKEEVDITVLDMMGREACSVYNGVLAAGEQTQKIPELAPGIYFVKLMVGNNRLSVKKLVVN